MRLRKFYDETRSCWAVQAGDHVEYFNHETPEHDKKNADACFKLLKKQFGEKGE